MPGNNKLRTIDLPECAAFYMRGQLQFVNPKVGVGSLFI